MSRHESHPFIAIWETTQSCDLACVHCRACAKPERALDELSTEAGKHLLERLHAGGVTLVVLTGGDPAKRPDLVELVAYGRTLGLVMGLTPSATPLVTEPLIDALAEAGLARLAISIDGPTADIHDAFRGVPGSFEHSLRILAYARARGISTQINTTVHAGSVRRLRETAEVVRAAGCALWSLFYIVPTGRAKTGMLPTAEMVEETLFTLAEIAERESFGIKTTAAPHYRRVLVQRKKQTGAAPEHGVRGRAGIRVNDGRGFLFVSHTGEVFPSGFLPISCGNVRNEDVIDVYRTHPLFRSLRDPDELRGKCGACQFKDLCGGSRARAYAMTGDCLDSDPLCSYQPPGYRPPHRNLVVVRD